MTNEQSIEVLRALNTIAAKLDKSDGDSITLTNDQAHAVRWLLGQLGLMLDVETARGMGMAIGQLHQNFDEVKAQAEISCCNRGENLAAVVERTIRG